MRNTLLAGLLALAAPACGGKVVVDTGNVGGAGGEGVGGSGVGASGSTSSTGTQPCAVTAAPGHTILTVCVDMVSSGGCAQDQIQSRVASLMQTCPEDTFCECAFGFVSAPCPPSAGCCYSVEVSYTPTVCE